MLTRRAFVAALAGLPVIGKFLPTPTFDQSLTAFDHAVWDDAPLPSIPEYAQDFIEYLRPIAIVGRIGERVQPMESDATGDTSA